MKKYLIFLCCLFWGFSAQSNTMCVANDTVAIVLDPTITATSSSRNEDTHTWRTVFPYGVIEGVITCQTASSGTISAEPNEANGPQCWCKMTSPAVSAWVFYGGMGSTERCSSMCDYYCKGLAVEKKRQMFSSIHN